MSMKRNVVRGDVEFFLDFRNGRFRERRDNFVQLYM